MRVIVLFVVLNAVFGKEIETDVRMVHIIFRHGLRYPKATELYPKDPHANHFPKELYTLLTEKGKRDSYALGQFLRERYNGLLSTSNNKQFVQAASTAYNRTVMTAQLVLQGLFQASLEDTLKETFNWNDLPYHVEQRELDTNSLRCPAYNNEYERVKNSFDYKQVAEHYDGLLQYLTNNTGVNITNLMGVNDIYQTLTAESSLGFALPHWAKSVYPEKVQEGAAMFFKTANYNNLLTRLNGGKFLKEIIDHMLDYVDDKPNKSEAQMYLLSGHDRTVVSALTILDLFELHVPKYNSAVIFELHELNNTKQYLIKIFYLKGTNLELEELFVKGCRHICKFEDFVTAMESKVVSNREVECSVNV